MTVLLPDLRAPAPPEPPHGVLVYDGEPRTDLWYAVRRAGITATDIAAIVGAYDPGYQHARTPLHIWLDKRGELPPDAGPSHYAEAGTRLEPVIADWWADAHHTQISETGIWVNLEHPWMRCSPDRIVHTCPDNDGPCGLEIKNRNAYAAGKWRDDVPDDVLSQVAWTMAVTGWGHVHVAVLVGGNTPIWHRVDREPTLETYLIGEAAQLWQAHLDGVPPQVDASAALARLYEALYTQRAGARTIPTGQAADLYQRYAEGKRLENEGKAQVAAARAEAIAVLDDAEDLCVDGRVKPLATFRRGEDQTALPVEQLRRLAGVHPRIYARLVKEGFIVTTTPARVLRWAKRVGQTLVDVDE